MMIAKLSCKYNFAIV